MVSADRINAALNEAGISHEFAQTCFRRNDRTKMHVPVMKAIKLALHPELIRVRGNESDCITSDGHDRLYLLMIEAGRLIESVHGGVSFIEQFKALLSRA